ncbi:MAG: hypothetical protein ACI81L_003526 [Verrucomicrobiales bacterium]
MTNPFETTFTDEEYEEFFGAPGEPRVRRTLSRRVRILGLFIAGAMLAGGLLTLVNNVRTNPDIREPAAIEATAWELVGESSLGWLVENIRIVPIPEPRVGAFVTNNPPDGIIQIDLRPWTDEGLEELMDHEIGHLLDFAIWEPTDPDRKNGLGTEAWAECAAVDAGSRRIDPRDPGGEYHCFDDELIIYRAALSAVKEVCTRWGDRDCRSLAR